MKYCLLQCDMIKQMRKTLFYGLLLYGMVWRVLIWNRVAEQTPSASKHPWEIRSKFLKYFLKVKDMVGKLYTVEPSLPATENKVAPSPHGTCHNLWLKRISQWHHHRCARQILLSSSIQVEGVSFLRSQLTIKWKSFWFQEDIFKGFASP